MVADIAEACEAWLGRRGFGSTDSPDEDDDAQAVIQSASIAGKSALSRARRTERVGGRERWLPAKCAAYGGYNLHAGVVVGAKDRKGLERLCRYVNRPPLGEKRLTELADGRVRLELKTAWSDGTTALELTPEELVERLVALVPAPKANQVRYHGVFAPRHALRRAVVRGGGAVAPKKYRRKLVKVASPGSRWVAWAALLWRSFGFDGWKCDCGGRMRLRAVVERPAAATRILRGLARASQGPP